MEMFSLPGLRSERKRLWLTQRELATKLQVSLDTISKWETGKRRTNWVQVWHVAKTLGVHPEKLTRRPLDTNLAGSSTFLLYSPGQ
jgi:transcriptional regulator with XRE-family HTH domain